MAKQKEALKGKMGSVTKKAAPPAPLKPLTVETDNKPPADSAKSEKLIDAPSENTPELKPQEDFEDDGDDFDRDDEEPPMSKQQLEDQSSNSVTNLQRL